MLQKEKQANITNPIIETLLMASKPLNYHYSEMIAEQLYILADGNNSLEKKIMDFLNMQRRNDKWRRYKVVAAILAAILLCLVIFLISK